MSGVNIEPGWWRGKKVAQLPDAGVLLVATDLQGNWADYCALKALYAKEKDQGNAPVLLFCGDMVHGPSEELATSEAWPEFLGTLYEDRSAEVVLDFMEFSSKELAVALLGNHEHAHIGGPVVSKFHPDEAAILNARLGDRVEEVCEFLSVLPLIATASCGASFCHGAPRRTEPTLEGFERIEYAGFDQTSIVSIHEHTTLGALLWSRHATAEQARAFREATSGDEGSEGFVAYGHDVVRDGFEKIGDEQLCLSTSFGLHDEHKTYLRLDLSKRYASVHDLRVGRELRPLYPQ